MGEGSRRLWELGSEDWAKWEGILARFDRAWQQGARPALEEYLPPADAAERFAVLNELAHLELEYRLKAGEPARVEEYLTGNPELGQHRAAVPELTAAEHDLRRRLGPPVAVTEYFRRFPEYREELTSLLPAREDTHDSLRTVPYEPPAVQWEPSDEFAPGTLLNNRYVLERVLGRGSMGQVFLGRDSVLDRSVAVKVIRPRDPHLRDRSLYEASLREAFIEEARTGANLTHPAIATVLDFGFHEGEPFIVFEYIAGETLHEVIRRRGRLPLEEVRLILGPLAQALDFAHSHHIVHRDLKPENIRATAQGHFKILDFGLAKAFRHQVDWSFAGTPAYASPEQAAGLPCDGRTDQYALALIAHEMLSGHRLFENTDWRELLRMHREQEPLSPRRFVPDLPESVCNALLRALQKDPNLRLASCEEFAVAFGCQLLNAPVPLPEILRLTEVPRMWGEWNDARFRIATAVYLVLSRDALWVAYRGEIRCWPLRALTEVRRNWWGNDLHLRFHRASQVVRQAFGFAKCKECQQWYESLQDLKSHSPGDASVSAEWPQIEPVVLMRRPPAMRYQALGPVEFQDAKPSRAEVGLQVRAAMTGADAVVDVQEERLPQLGRTVHRRSGMAIKAVDTAGRRELRSRWFATQVSQLSRWMLILIGVSLLVALLGSSLLSIGGIGIPLSPGETISHRFAVVTLVVVLIHSWPLAVALLTRWLLWPQLLRAAALAILALGAKHLAGLGGLLAAGVVHGRWADDGTVFLVTLLDPINLAILLPAYILFRRAWRAYEGYRNLAPDAEQGIPSTRRAGGLLTLATSVLYLLLLAGFVAWSQSRPQSNFAFPGNESWAWFNAGQHFVRQSIAGISAQVTSSEGLAAKAEGNFALQSVTFVPGSLNHAEFWIDLKPTLALAHNNLGLALKDKGDWDGAIACYKKALELDPKLALAHNNLGNALKGKGDLDGAIACYKKALHLDPKQALFYNNLGAVLQDKGCLDEAIAEFREALRIQKDYANAHSNLKITLARRDALAKLPAILSGKAKATDTTEQLTLAFVCQQPYKRLYAAATYFYSEAFAAEPQLAGDQPSDDRYNAACAAALAGCRKGKDADKLDAKERARLRRQALDWLRADLKAWRQVLDKASDQGGPAIVQQMQHWLKEDDFAGVRGSEALARLPEAERPSWQKLWEEVEALRQRAAGKPAAASPARPSEKR
jgi:serine/threonine-protein kinase